MASDRPESAPLLSVRGEASLEAPPEVADLAIAITARDTSRERVLERLAARNDECLAVLRGYGDALAKIDTSALAIYPELKPGARREQVRAYRGSVRIDVAVVDFTILGELIGRVSDADLTTVSGPWWRLRPDSPVRRRVREEAARDAIVRAREYAEAIGSRLTGLVELADQGLAMDAGRPHPHAAPMALAARAAASEPPAFDLEPQTQVVEARVEARFTIAQPQGL